MEWIQLSLQYGLPTFLLISVVVGLYKGAWPVAVRAWDEQQAERREERERFLSTLERFDHTINEERKSFQVMLTTERAMRLEERNLFLSVLDKHTEKLTGVTEKLGDITDAVTELQHTIGNNSHGE